MTDIDTLIAEVRRLDSEATPGPWRPEGASIRVNLPGGIEYQWATAAYPRDNNLIATFRTAAPLLAAEVQRLRADYDRQAAEIAAVYVALGADPKTIVRYKASVLVQRLRADVASLRQGWQAEREAARLTLAAEQGRQEGAPAGWERYRDGVWIRHLADGCHLRVERLDGIVWRWWANARNGAWDKRSGDAATARAAMQAADAAQEPR